MIERLLFLIQFVRCAWCVYRELSKGANESTYHVWADRVHQVPRVAMFAARGREAWRVTQHALDTGFARMG